MARVGISDKRLAHELGISPQYFNNMRRKEDDAGLRIANVARAADLLRCDFRWLCTGDGDYVSADTWVARRVADLVNGLAPADQARYHLMTSRIVETGVWPLYPDEQPPPNR